jgi:hypothetical protein
MHERAAGRPHDRRPFQARAIEGKSRNLGGLEVGGPDRDRAGDLMNAIHV